MTHELKIWPQYFEHVVSGNKTFEVRENDRGFQPGDIVLLSEWDPTVIEKEDHWGPSGQTDYYRAPIGYTKRSAAFRIGYVFPIENNRVVFSLLEMKK